MSYYYSLDLNTSRQRYISKIKKQREKVKKNFEEMDFENASARNDAEKTVNDISSACDALISKLYRM